jgi:hypothetical protein
MHCSIHHIAPNQLAAAYSAVADLHGRSYRAVALKSAGNVSVIFNCQDNARPTDRRSSSKQGGQPTEQIQMIRSIQAVTHLKAQKFPALF